MKLFLQSESCDGGGAIYDVGSQYVHPVVKRIMEDPVCNVEQGTQEWLNQRKQFLTASDGAAVLGQNPYSSRKDVFNNKIGKGRPFSGGRACAHGHKYEPVAAHEFCKRTGKSMVHCGLVPHPSLSWLAGSPDGITLDGCLVEIKCPMSREIDLAAPPSYYIAQVQILMDVLDLPHCHFVEFRPSDEWHEMQYVQHEVPRDRDWFAKNSPIMEAFMQEVYAYRLAPPPPPPSGEPLKKRRKTSPKPVTSGGSKAFEGGVGVCLLNKRVKSSV